MLLNGLSAVLFSAVFFVLNANAGTFKCSPTNQVLFVASPPTKEVTWAAGNVRGPNRCTEEDWAGPDMLYHGSVIRPLGLCLQYEFVYCRDLTVSEADDPSLSPAIKIPYDLPGFPKSVRLTKVRYDEILDTSNKGCDVVELILEGGSLSDCLSDIHHRNPSPPSNPSPT
jgi:hypothetical protein